MLAHCKAKLTPLHSVDNIVCKKIKKKFKVNIFFQLQAKIIGIDI